MGFGVMIPEVHHLQVPGAGIGFAAVRWCWQRQQWACAACACNKQTSTSMLLAM